MALEQTGIGSLPTVSASDLEGLQRILRMDIPVLRRIISPSHYGKAKEEVENEE